MISTKSLLRELSYLASTHLDVTDFLEDANSTLNAIPLTETEYNKVTEHLRLDILDVEQYVKKNECQPITNPRAFIRDNIPSDDGLLSNKIFGITKDDRAGIFAYIDLHGWFMDPSCYKTWIRMDSGGVIKSIVHGTKTYKINEKGEFVEDPDGETGIEFLRRNIKKINFKRSSSIRRDIKVDYLEQNRDRIFIQKYIVIPPYYRDKNSENSRTVGLGGINKLYSNLIVATNALTATQDYTFDASDAMRGRVQEIILSIYDWFCGNTNENINTDTGAGLSGKLGILRRTAMSKTANFAARLVISAPELKVERPEDMMVSFDKSAIPLSATIAEFRDFVLFHAKRFFENEFLGIESYPIVDKSGKLKYVVPQDPEVAFSDERIKREMDRFIHGYNNRFVPIELPIEQEEGSKSKYYMMFKGRGTIPGKERTNPESIYHRRLTWCDVFFIACNEAVRDKQVLITRFPIDSFSNQITTGIVVSSTKDTEPMYFNGTFYPYYPKIRDEDIGTDTSNKFVDTLKLSNLYLPGMGGDYDGDQVTCKGVYTEEANQELREFLNSKENFMDFGCKPLRASSGDVIQSIYALTRILNPDDVTKSSAIQYK